MFPQMVSVHSFQSSRDPAGVDPSGMDVITGADPPPDESDFLEVPPPSPAGPPPPTPRRDHSAGNYHHGAHAPSPVMAFLVGNPPPPPPTPPPRRPRHSPSRSRRIEGHAEPQSRVTPVFMGDDTLRHHQQQQYRQQQVAEYYQQTTKPVGNSNMVEQRLYDTDEYYAAYERQRGNANQEMVPSPPIMTNTQLVDRENEPPNGFAAMASPRSAVTEPHSNKGVKPRKINAANEQRKVQSASKSGKNNRSTTKQHKNKGRKSAGEPTSSRKTKAVVEEKNQDKTHGHQATPHGSGQKMGFIKKLFRGGKRKDAERLSDNDEDDSLVEEPLKETTQDSYYPEILPPPQEFSQGEENVTPYAQVTFHGPPSIKDNYTHIGAQSQLAFETRSKEERASLSLSEKEAAGLETAASNLTNDVDVDPDHQEVFFAHDEVSALTLPTINSHSRRSVDPDEAYTVQSGVSSEPLGRYWRDREKPEIKGNDSIDPFTVPFFQEPDGESPMMSKQQTRKASKTNLHVQVPSGADPAGETPPDKGSTMNVQEPSPRGWESPVVELKDPQGSTPSSEVKRRVLGSGRSGSLPSPFVKGTPPLPPHEMRREPSAFLNGSPYALDPSPVKPSGDEKEETIKTGTPNRLPPTGRNSVDKRVAAEPPSPSLIMALQATQPPTPNVRPEESSKIAAPASNSDVRQTKEKHRKPTFTPRSDEKTTLPVQKCEDREPATAAIKRMPIGTPHPRNPDQGMKHYVAKADTDDVTDFLDNLFHEGATATKSRGINEPSHTTTRRKYQRVSCEEKKEEPLFGNSIERACHAQNVLGKKMLATSTAALGTAASMNAKTVAYLHTLNGEPSPRHAWRRTDLSDDEYSPVRSETQKKAISKIKAVMEKKSHPKAWRTDEDAFHDFVSVEAPKVISITRSARFQSGTMNPDSGRKSLDIVHPLPSMNSVLQVEVTAVSFGLDLIRLKRHYDTMSGRAELIQPIKRQPKKHASQEPQFMTEEDVKDPIQRAGLRLLAKAAVPIQSTARRYLAQLDFIKRMQALVIIQAYFRRWECEAILRSYVHVSYKIQAIFRSWHVRKNIAFHHYHAAQVQKIFRGYRARVSVQDIIFWVTRIQAHMRGWLGRIHYDKLLQLRLRKAVILQSWLRGCKGRQGALVRSKAVVTIQATYRAYSAKIKYQLRIGDILVVQSALRQFLAQKVVNEMRMQKMQVAASKIQAAWRGFQGYTDYIFSLVDILVLQRTFRKWLARTRLNELRKNKAAIMIQSQWRRQTALIGMLYDLVHIIIIQSVARRFLVKLKIPQLRDEKVRRDMVQMRLDMAATKVQAVWRGFWGYSHFIIVQYEIIRLQAIVRGKIARSRFSLQLGCCIMIQSAARRYLANQRAFELKREKAFIEADVHGMRSKFASRRIQFWWRVVLECSKEKKAALIIERFFLMVKAEVDREIKRQHALKARSSTQRRNCQQHTLIKKQLGSEWVKRTDEPGQEVFASDGGSRSRSAPRLRPNPSYMSDSSSDTTTPKNAPVKKRHSQSASDPKKMEMIMRQAYELKNRRESELHHRQLSEGRSHSEQGRSSQSRNNEPKPPSDVTLARGSDDKSEVSAITTPTIFNRRKRSKLSKTKKVEDDELSLDEEAMIDADIQNGGGGSPGKASDVRSSAMNSVPNKVSKQMHFFGEEENSVSVLKKSGKPPKARRHHSTSSLASNPSECSDGVSPVNTHARTATTASASRSDAESSLRGWTTSNLPSPQVDKKYGSDKYNAAPTQKKSPPNNKESPRYERIMVTKSSADFPLLESDSLDNVEVEYVDVVETEYGLI